MDMDLMISIRIHFFFLTKRDCHSCCCGIMKKEDLLEYSQRLGFGVGVGEGGLMFLLCQHQTVQQLVIRIVMVFHH